VFRFIETEKATFPIAFPCRHLSVSTRGYYAWRTRRPSARAVVDTGLSRTIRHIHLASRGTYGAPRIHAELADAYGLRCGRKRVARLMRRAGLVGVCRRQVVPTTRRDPTAPVSDDLVHRAFTAPEPNRLWVAAITYVPRADHLRTELVLDALEMARWNRRPGAGLVHHSDHGCQYTSLAFGQRCRQAGITVSMGSVGDSYDCDDPGALLRAA
jgi:putative transposase